MANEQVEVSNGVATIEDLNVALLNVGLGKAAARNAENATAGKALGVGVVWSMDGVAYRNATGGDATLDLGVSDIELVSQDKQPFNAPAIMIYDPETLTVHTGALLYDSDVTRAWNIYSEAKSHAPEFGMSVYAEYSDSLGAVWVGKRTIYPGRIDRKVLAMSGRYVNGRIVVIVNTEDAGGERYLEMVYSDNAALSWTTLDITDVGSTEHFMFGTLYARDTASGGDDDDGLIFYTYTSGAAYAFHSVDKGATWTVQLVANGATSYLDANGDAQTGLDFTEIAVGKVPNEAKFVGYFRCVDEANFIAATSTDMLTFTNFRDSGIANEGSTLEVGTPPHIVSHQGRIRLVTFGRQSWMDHALELEQAMLVYSQNASSLYDAGGVFADTTPEVAMRLPSRAVGMMAHCDVSDGVLAVLRAGETVYADSADPATSQMYMLTTYNLPAISCRVRDNFADNPCFDVTNRGDTFTGVTVNNTPVVDRVQLWCSSATMGAAMEDVDPILGNSLPHRPTRAMRITSDAETFQGPQQVYFGKRKMAQISDTELTVSVLGIGVIPVGMRLSVIFNYGTGGSSEESEATLFPTGVSATGRATMISTTVKTPTMEGKTVTADASVTIRLDSATSQSWDFGFTGWKFERGNGATLMQSPNLDAEEVECQRYFSAQPDTLMIYNLTATQSVGFITHGQMAKLPSLTGTNLTSGYTIEHSAGTRAVTDITIDQQTATGCRVLLAHDSDTSFDVGGLYQTTAGSEIYLDAEAV